MQRTQNPVAAVPAVGYPGAHYASIGAVAVRKVAHGGEIALEVPAGNAEARSEVGVLTDALVEFQSWNDFRPVGANLLAELGESIGGADRGNQEHIDRDLGEFCALESHRQDWASVRAQKGRVRRGERCCGVGAADDVALRLQRPLDSTPEYQSLDLIVKDPPRSQFAACESGWYLRKNDDRGIVARRGEHGLEHVADRCEIATA